MIWDAIAPIMTSLNATNAHHQDVSRCPGCKSATFTLPRISPQAHFTDDVPITNRLRLCHFWSCKVIGTKFCIRHDSGVVKCNTKTVTIWYRKWNYNNVNPPFQLICMELYIYISLDALYFTLATIKHLRSHVPNPNGSLCFCSVKAAPSPISIAASCHILFILG